VSGFGALAGLRRFTRRPALREDRAPGAIDAALAHPIRALLATLGTRDGDTAHHCRRVAAVADRIAEQLGTLPPADRRDLRVACLLHDVGKLWTPVAVLRKAGALDADEWRQMRAHVEDGARLTLAVLAGARRAVRIIHQHHERIDGRGYPQGLRGAAILLEARIVAVADAFDALVSDRPYRRGANVAAALAELRRSAGHGPAGEEQFDRGVVEALAAALPGVLPLYPRLA
jgi:putative nucleotidyltransferase with HDIG domain